MREFTEKDLVRKNDYTMANAAKCFLIILYLANYHSIYIQIRTIYNE